MAPMMMNNIIERTPQTAPRATANARIAPVSRAPRRLDQKQILSFAFLCDLRVRHFLWPEKTRRR